MPDPRVMLITGTSRGIGRALAGHYVDAGYQVIGVSRGASDLEHAGYEHHTLDVTDEAAARTLFAGLASRHGRLDVLLNNAGIASMNHSLLTPLDTVRKVVETNLIATFLFAREAAKVMQKNRWGRIVNFTTVAVPLRLEGEAAYAAAKGGVKTLTEVLAREFGPLGITVNAVGPTPMATALTAGVPQDKIDALVARQAVQRQAEMRDVLNVVDFFLRDESDHITGQSLYLGGF